MIKLKLILFVVLQLLLMAFTNGQNQISDKGFEKAVDLANYKYVIYSMTKVKERESFIENCDCDKDPNFISIQNAISKTKTKTISFSKVFNQLKDVEIELQQKDIATFLTDSIFDNSFRNNYRRVFNYGNSRKNDLEFVAYKKDLHTLIVNMLNDYVLTPKNEEKEESISQKNEPVDTIVYEAKEPAWFNELNLFSIAISVLISLLVIGFLYLTYFNNTVSEGIKDYVHKKVSGSYFDKRFDENQSKINGLKKEITELKEQIRELQRKKMG